jgi:protein-S-isoprenylcysteine O-methyltransferase Ste14
MKLRKHDLEILGTSFAICLVFYVGRNSPWTSRHIAGAVLLAIGFIGWLTARLQIREFFAVTAQAQGLVITGLYSKIRNPIYFFGVILFAGMALYLTLPWWVLPVLLLIIFMQVLRARNEARVLEARFGDAYRQYRSKTWF